MASLRTWRTVTGALLLLVLATTGTPAIAEATSSGHQQQAHYVRAPARRRTGSAWVHMPGLSSDAFLCQHTSFANPREA